VMRSGGNGFPCAAAEEAGVEEEAGTGRGG
jgi:hypothetical protein